MIRYSDKTVQKEFLDQLVCGNYSECLAMAENYIEKGFSIQELYEDIFKNSLYEIGELWEHNKISVATEHLASAIVESLLNEFYSRILINKSGTQKAMLACVENEFHQIGIKMVNDVFEMNGWDVQFLGANAPIEKIVKLSKVFKPDVFAVSFSLFFNLPNLEKTIERLNEEFPHIPILIGGQAFRHGGQELLLKYINVIYKPDLQSTENFIKSLNL
jgi:MerR family transcriptional regulator, light-induced transcriptional regulator